MGLSLEIIVCILRETSLKRKGLNLNFLFDKLVILCLYTKQISKVTHNSLLCKLTYGPLGGGLFKFDLDRDVPPNP